MKKRLSIVLASVMMAALLAGCSQKAATGTKTTAAAETTAEKTTAEETTAEETETETEAPAAGGLKTGLAIVSSLESSKDAGEKDGNAQVDSIAVAVVVDAEGKIVNCMIDTAQNKMAFTAEGKVVMKDEFKTKKELGDDYGMKAASGIGKEWFEQAEALEQYVIGKTADEVAGREIEEITETAEAEKTAGVTIKIGSYQEAVVEAVNNAQELGTQEGDKLGLGIITNMNKSKDADGDKEGQCQAYSTYAAVTIDGDGKITAAVIDSTQGTVKFDAAGKITSDLTAGVKTKKQLGDDYGMKAASGIGKEWFEQAAAMEAYVTGKTADEVAGIAVDEDGKTTDADLAASVTVSINGYQEVIAKAAAVAR